jgi:hypothetical protein
MADSFFRVSRSYKTTGKIIASVLNLQIVSLVNDGVTPSNKRNISTKGFFWRSNEKEHSIRNILLAETVPVPNLEVILRNPPVSMGILFLKTLELPHNSLRKVG